MDQITWALTQCCAGLVARWEEARDIQACSLGGKAYRKDSNETRGKSVTRLPVHLRKSAGRSSTFDHVHTPVTGMAVEVEVGSNPSAPDHGCIHRGGGGSLLVNNDRTWEEAQECYSQACPRCYAARCDSLWEEILPVVPDNIPS